MNHALLCGSTSLEIGTSKCYRDQGWHHTNSQSLTQRRERRGQRRVGHASSLPGRRFNEDSDEQATPPLSRAGAWTTTGGRNSDKQLGRLPAEQRRRHGKAPLDGVASTTARLRRLCTACCAICGSARRSSSLASAAATRTQCRAFLEFKAPLTSMAAAGEGE